MRRRECARPVEKRRTRWPRQECSWAAPRSFVTRGVSGLIHVVAGRACAAAAPAPCLPWKVRRAWAKGARPPTSENRRRGASSRWHGRSVSAGEPLPRAAEIAPQRAVALRGRATPIVHPTRCLLHGRAPSARVRTAAPVGEASRRRAKGGRSRARDVAAGGTGSAVERGASHAGAAPARAADGLPGAWERAARAGEALRGRMKRLRRRGKLFPRWGRSCKGGGSAATLGERRHPRGDRLSRVGDALHRRWKRGARRGSVCVRGGSAAAPGGLASGAMGAASRRRRAP